MLALDCDLRTKLDFAKPGHPKVAALLAMEVLFIDEVSMIDVDCWRALSHILFAASHAKRPEVPPADDFGEVSMILFGHPWRL